MNNPITMFDYNFDWVIQGPTVEPYDHEGTLSREEIIQFYGSLDIAGVELQHLYWADLPAGQVKKIVEDAGSTVNAYILGLDMSLPDPAERKKTQDEARMVLDRAREMNANLVMIFPGFLKDGMTEQQLYDWSVESLRVCAEHCESLGLILAIENIDYAPSRPLHGTGPQCVKVCEAVDSPAFRLIFDAGATPFLNVDAVETLRVMQPYIAHVHVKNCRRPFPDERLKRTRDGIDGTTYTGTVMDSGIVSIPAVLEELKRINYTGSLLIEYQGENDPRPALQYNLEYLQRSLASLAD